MRGKVSRTLIRAQRTRISLEVSRLETLPVGEPSRHSDRTGALFITIKITKSLVDFRSNRATGLPEMVIAESLLPQVCAACGQPGSVANDLRFLGPLPRFFWQVLIGIPALFVVWILITPLVRGEALGHALDAGAAAAALAGGAIGLWVAQGAFRRTRNVMTFYLCDRHAPGYRKLEIRRKIAKGVLLVVFVLTLFWGPAAILLVFLGEGPAGWMIRAAFAGTPSALLLGWLPLRVPEARKKSLSVAKRRHRPPRPLRSLARFPSKRATTSSWPAAARPE